MKKQSYIFVILMLFAICNSFAQQKTPGMPKSVRTDPVGRLAEGRVLIGPDGEVHIICKCVAPFDEWCLTGHNNVIQRQYSELASSSESNSKSQISRKSLRTNLDLSEYSIELVSADTKQRLYILTKK